MPILDASGNGESIIKDGVVTKEGYVPIVITKSAVKEAYDPKTLSFDATKS